MLFRIKPIEKIEHTYHNFKRFEEIIEVIFKYNLQTLIEGIELPAAINFFAKKYFHADSGKIKEMPQAKRVRLALQELGPTFIKLGQILSLRVELLPVEITEELALLQDHVQSFSAEKARSIISRELGREVSEIFKQFEDVPIGSASLGQVHRAQLFDGQTVAVKVQRPDITGAIETDFEILMYLADFAEKNIEEFKYRRPTKFLEEVYYALERELDYEHEQTNIQRFSEEFDDDPTVYIMKCFPRLTTKTVLTMEYVDGIKVKKVDQLEQNGFDRSVIADRGVDSLLKQIFENGFFHADPHPGNIFVLRDNVVSFIDFGMVGRLSRKNREVMADFLYSVSQRNASKAVKFLDKITEHPKNVDTELLEREMAELIDRYVSKSLEEVSIAQLFANLSNVLSNHKMIFPSHFSMMLKTIATVEGVGRTLDPNINLTAKLRPYFQRLRMSRFHPINLADDLDGALVHTLELVREIPDQFQEFLNQMVSGESTFKVEHKGSKAFYSFWNQIVNRAILALILAALLISSSIMVLSDVPPKWHEIPVVGLVGFIIAGLMSLRLLIAIWRKGMF